MKVVRYLRGEILRRISSKNSKIIVIYGARQVGKTTFVGDFFENKFFRDKKILKIDGDNFKYRDILSSQDVDKLSDLVDGLDVLFIDEAQRIENIGINLKILYDNFKDLRIIVTGSSSFELANKIKEPLTGRTYTYCLYPISYLELLHHKNKFELKKDIEHRLMFGSYPEVFTIRSFKDKVDYLRNISSDYLYRDVLELGDIAYSNKLRSLVKILAFQIGSEVSYNEIATSLGISRQTVESYIDLLEKSFVLIRLYGFSRNLRKEVTKKPKIYFYDLGIRNAIIENFAYLDSRNDVGALWENFLVIERLKRNEYKRHFCSSYFWRVYTGAEIDYIEEYDGVLFGYEIKWDKQSKIPKSWLENYSDQYQNINRDNFLEFIL